MFSRSLSRKAIFLLHEARPVKSYCYNVWSIAVLGAMQSKNGITRSVAAMSWMGWRVSWRFQDDHSSMGQSWTSQNPTLLSTARGSSGWRLASFHIFVNASGLAYPSFSYAIYGYVSGQISVALVTANVRVSPMKSVSIPCLELIAAVLGLWLAVTISEKLEIPLSQDTLWTDSMDVIYCIQGHSRRLKPFAANRVAKIQRKSDSAQWRNVPKEQNPASRGLDLKNLSAESRWF